MSKPFVGLSLVAALVACFFWMSQNQEENGIVQVEDASDSSPELDQSGIADRGREAQSIERNVDSQVNESVDIPEPKVATLSDCLNLLSSTAVVDCLLGSETLLSEYSLSKILLGELPDELKYLSEDELEAVITALLIRSSPETAVESLLAMMELSKTKFGASQPGTSAFYEALPQMDQEVVQALLLTEARVGEKSESLYLLQAFPESVEVGNTLSGLAVDILRTEEVRTAALGAYCNSLRGRDEGGLKREVILRDILSPYQLNQEQAGSRLIDTAVYFGIEGMIENPDGPLTQVLVEVLSSPRHKGTVERAVQMFRGTNAETDLLLDRLGQ